MRFERLGRRLAIGGATVLAALLGYGGARIRRAAAVPSAGPTSRRR